MFRKAEDLNRIVLPVSFDETKEAVALNLRTRKTALEYLGQGGAIGIFPGGTVSTAIKPFAQPTGPGLADVHGADDRQEQCYRGAGVL